VASLYNACLNIESVIDTNGMIIVIEISKISQNEV